MAVKTYLKQKDPEINKYFSKCFVCGDDNPYGLHLTNTYIDGKSHVEGRPGIAQMGLTVIIIKRLGAAHPKVLSPVKCILKPELCSRSDDDIQLLIRTGRQNHF